MYRYDQFDHTIVRERVNQFRDQVARRLSGALTEDEFAASCHPIRHAVVKTDAHAGSYRPSI